MEEGRLGGAEVGGDVSGEVPCWGVGGLGGWSGVVAIGSG